MDQLSTHDVVLGDTLVVVDSEGVSSMTQSGTCQDPGSRVHTSELFRQG